MIRFFEGGRGEQTPARHEGGVGDTSLHGGFPHFNPFRVMQVEFGEWDLVVHPPLYIGLFLCLGRQREGAKHLVEMVSALVQVKNLGTQTGGTHTQDNTVSLL